MGKRKRATKPPPKKKAPKLEKVFNCPFCGHEESVECTISKSDNLGRLECRVCGVQYSTTVGRLEEEIDVYYKWIDACDAANRAAGAAADGAEEHEIEAATEQARAADAALGDDEEQQQHAAGRRREGVKVVVHEDDVDEEAV